MNLMISQLQLQLQFCRLVGRKDERWADDSRVR